LKNPSDSSDARSLDTIPHEAERCRSKVQLIRLATTLQGATIFEAGLSPSRRAETSLLGSVDSCSSSEDLQIREGHANLWQKRSDQQSRLTQLFYASKNAVQPEPSKRMKHASGFAASHLKWATWFSVAANHDPCEGKLQPLDVWTRERSRFVPGIWLLDRCVSVSVDNH
jgi:hypothetical protein